MEFAVGTTLGAVSLLAGFKGAIDGYQMIANIAKSVPQANYLVTKIEIERHRLGVWGDNHGLSGTNNNTQSQRLMYSDDVTKTILRILAEVVNTLTDIEKLANRYGLRPVDIDPNQHGISDTRLYVETVAKAMKSGHTKTPMWNKFRWVVDDNSKLEGLCNQLKYWNDSLDELVNPPQEAALHRALSAHLMPQLTNHTSLSIIQRATRTKITASYATFERMKQQPNIAAVAAMASGSQIDMAALTFEPEPAGAPLSMATYQQGNGMYIPVMVEWKSLEKNISSRDYDIVLDRALRVGCQLAVPKIPESGTLECLGIVEDGGQKRLGTVYGLPAPDVETDRPPVTLAALLEASQKDGAPVPCLGDRFRLAKAITTAVLLVHASDIHHKGINPNSILFFRPQASSKPPSITEPFIAGFTHAKLVNDTGFPENPAPGSTYQRPGSATLQTYTKLDDIYSLGVMLFEIGMWRSAQQWKRARMSASAFRDELLKNVPALGGAVGEIYQNAVHCCLTADFDVQPTEEDGAKLEKAYWAKVVKQLDMCNA